MEHTLKIVESDQALATASICSCGMSMGYIPHELIHQFGTGYYRRHQHQTVLAWERHRRRKIDRPYSPVECTVYLQGGPKDCQKITVPFHIYKGGYLFVQPHIPWAYEPGYEPDKRVEPFMYTRDPDNPLIWSV